jgi:hypothetical protein
MSKLKVLLVSGQLLCRILNGKDCYTREGK